MISEDKKENVNTQVLNSDFSCLKLLSVEHTTKGDLKYEMLLDDNIITCDVYHLSIDPMRIIEHVLITRGIQTHTLRTNKVITQIFVDKEESKKLEIITNETLSHRCYVDIERNKPEIIRQLPFEVAMNESEKILSKNIKHAIYASERGGYNIKTIGYENYKLDKYFYKDTNMWD